MEKILLKNFGFAPGNYTCICISCEIQYIGDKRSLSCKECAENAREEYLKEERDE